MHKLGYVVAIGALALALSACSGAPEAGAPGDERGLAVAADTAESTPAPTGSETPLPLTAESADPTTAADTGYLAEVRLRLSWYAGATAIPNATDDQLIAAGHNACDQLAGGTLYKDLRLVEGEQRNADGELTDTGAIASAAILNYCPELNVEATYAE